MKTAIVDKPMTAKAFLRDYFNAPGVELVKGHLVRYPMTGAVHGVVVVRISVLLDQYARRKKTGRIVSGEVGIYLQRNPPTFRAADVAYVSYQRLAKDRPVPQGPLEVVPELVVEVKSPSDRLKAMRQKVEDYLSAGVDAVMVVDPETEIIALFRDDEFPIRFHNGDTVTIPDVLPGFAAKVKAFFE